MSTTAMDRAEPLDDGKPFYKDFSSCQDLNLVLVAFVIVDPLMTTGSEVATATENRLHIYKRPCCTGSGADPDTNRSVGLQSFAVVGSYVRHAGLVEFTSCRSDLSNASSRATSWVGRNWTRLWA